MKYQIRVALNNKALCHIEVVQLQSPQQAVKAVLAQFPPALGFQCEVFAVHEQKRILEVSHDGIKVLSRQQDYQRVESL